MRAAVKTFEWLLLCDPSALLANFQRDGYQFSVGLTLAVVRAAFMNEKRAYS